MTTIDVTGRKEILQTLSDMKKGGKSDTAIDRPEEAQAILSFARNTMQHITIDDKNTKTICLLLADAIESLSFLKFKGAKHVLEKLNNLSSALRDSKNNTEGLMNDAMDIVM